METAMRKSMPYIMVIGLLAVLMGTPFAVIRSSSLTGVWSPTGSLTTARGFHTATLLPSGKVLVAGGYDGDSLASAELYDPSTGKWSPTGSLSIARAYHTATLLPNGKVLVVGGFDVFGDSLADAELYDTRTGTWSRTGSMILRRSFSSTPPIFSK